MPGGRIGKAARTTALLFAVLVVLPATRAYAPPPQPQPTFSRSPDRGMPGSVITLSGTDCQLDGQAMEYVVVDMRSHAKKPDGTSQFVKTSDKHPINPDGSWQFQFTVPADAPLGDYTLRGYCWADDMVLHCGQAVFTVGEPLPPTTTTTTTAPPAPTTTAPPAPTTTTTAERSRRATTTAPTTSTTITTAAAPEPTGSTTTSWVLRSASDAPPGAGRGLSSHLWLVVGGLPVFGAAGWLLARRRRPAAPPGPAA